jgi:hypothetical protein
MSQLLFQTTVRSLSCDELADDSAQVARLKELYDTLDSGTTPTTVLLPWLPGPSMLKKLWATKQIYDIVVQAIDARQRSGASKPDTLQMLLDEQDERLVIVGVSSFEFAFRRADVSIVHYGSASRRRKSDWDNRFVAHHLPW